MSSDTTNKGLAERNITPTVIQDDVEDLQAFTEAILVLYWARRYASSFNSTNVEQSRLIISKIIEKLVDQIEYWKRPARKSNVQVYPGSFLATPAHADDSSIPPELSNYTIQDADRLRELARRCADDHLTNEDFDELDCLARLLSHRVVSELDEPLPV